MKFNYVKFRGLMAEREFNDAKLAKKLKVSRITVFNLRHGKCDPDTELMTRIMKVFGYKKMDDLIVY